MCKAIHDQVCWRCYLWTAMEPSLPEVPWLCGCWMLRPLHEDWGSWVEIAKTDPDPPHQTLQDVWSVLLQMLLHRVTVLVGKNRYCVGKWAATIQHFESCSSLFWSTWCSDLPLLQPAQIWAGSGFFLPASINMVSIWYIIDHAISKRFLDRIRLSHFCTEYVLTYYFTAFDINAILPGATEVLYPFCVCVWLGGDKNAKMEYTGVDWVPYLPVMALTCAVFSRLFFNASLV